MVICVAFHALLRCPSFANPGEPAPNPRDRSLHRQTTAGVYRNHHNSYHKGCAQNSLSLLCTPAPHSRLPDLSERVYVNEPLSSRGTSARGGLDDGGGETGSRTFSWISPAGGFWFLGESDGDGSDQQTQQQQEQELEQQLQEHQSRLRPLSTGGSWRTSSAGSFASARSFASSVEGGLSEIPAGGPELVSGGETPETEQQSPAEVVAMAAAVAAALEEKSSTSDDNGANASEFSMPKECEEEEEGEGRVEQEEEKVEEESIGVIPSPQEQEEVHATAAVTTAAVATATAPAPQPPAEQPEGVDDKSGSGSPVVARHTGSTTDGSWHGQMVRGSSPLVGLSYVNSPRSLMSLSDGGGGGSCGGDGVRGTARVGSGAVDSSHSSGELTYSRTPPLAAVRAAVAAATAPTPTSESVEAAIAAAARFRDSSEGGGWTLNNNSIRVQDEEGPAWLVALDQGAGAAASLPESAERAAAVDRGRGTGHRGDFAGNTAGRSPSPRQQGQQPEEWRGHRHHLLPRETDLP